MRHTRRAATLRRGYGGRSGSLTLTTATAPAATLDPDTIIAQLCALFVEEAPTDVRKGMGPQRHYADGCARYLHATRRGEAPSLPPCVAAFVRGLCALQDAGADPVHLCGALGLALLERQRQLAAAAPATDDHVTGPALVLSVAAHEVGEMQAAGYRFLNDPTPERAAEFDREAREAEQATDRVRDAAARARFTVRQGAIGRRVYGADLGGAA